MKKFILFFYSIMLFLTLLSAFTAKGTDVPDKLAYEAHESHITEEI